MIAIIVGTRPEVIKMAPVIREIEARGLDFILIHSNQHYSENMDKIFFDELSIREPHYNLRVGSGGHSNQTGNIMIKLEPILEKERPQFVLVQGDTNTVMAAALASHKLGIKVCHIEAGLRSYDRTMPEETNRVITDHISDFLFAVGPVQKSILKNEGVSGEKIFVVGNTIVDAVLQNKEIAKSKSQILKKLNLKPKEYCLFTAHRASNVDTKPSLEEVIHLLKHIPMKVCWPIHLRAQKKIDEFGLKLPPNVITTEPLGYLDFLNLEQFAQCIVTDSGGLQEEACILGIPCITVRENTERPETVDVGANVLIGRDVEKLTRALKREIASWKNPFGDGSTAKKILDVIDPPLSKSLETKTVSVVGMGYMGLPTALLLAQAGHNVHGFDINEKKVAELNQGICIFDEPGLSELLTSARSTGNFHVATSLKPADVFIIAVPTPHHDQKCDLSYVLKAAQSVAEVAKTGDLVIVESTIKPKTCVDHVAPIFKKMNKTVEVVHCPERAIPGDTLRELVHNDRIIGSMTEEGGMRTKALYSSFVKGKIFTTDVTVAEVAKLMENTYRDINIALANEFSLLADELNFNVHEAIKLANRHPRVNILSPGPGVGGHCIAIDPWFLTEDTQSGKLISTARMINDGMPKAVVKRLQKKLGALPKKVGILGVAYKKNVDDARETPALHIWEELIAQGCEVKAHDPLVKAWDYPVEKNLDSFSDWADAFLLVTDHDDYKSFHTKKFLLDTRNFYGSQV